MKEYSRIYAEVNLDMIRDNLKALKDNTAPGTKVCAVLKADGYGHGAVPIAKTIKDMVWGYAVATVDEALNLRLNQVEGPILVLGYVPQSRFKEAVEQEIRLTVFEREQAERLSKAAEEVGKKAHIHIKVDTGMGRIGLFPNEEGAALIKEISFLPFLDLEGIFTHMATADMEDKTAAGQQVESFQRFLAMLKKEGITFPIRHCSNSAGIIEMKSSHMDMVRAGISLYGFYPSDEVRRDLVALHPALELKSCVSYVKNVPPHTPISYGATYVTKKEERIATIPVGYGDGYPRSLSNKGYVLIHGTKAPICGRVCMDQMMVDVTGIEDVKEGDCVTLIGNDGGQTITVDELADLAGTFHYEFVCDLGRRIPRVYRKDGKIIGYKDWFDDRYQ